MLELKDLIYVEASEIKTYNDKVVGNNRLGLKRIERQKRKYVTITIHDKSSSSRGIVKSFNIDNPNPRFVDKIVNDISVWRIENTKVICLIDDGGGEQYQKVMTFNSVYLKYPSHDEEMTHPISKQVVNLSNSVPILAYRLKDSDPWITIGDE